MLKMCIRDSSETYEIPVQVNRAESMLTVFFTDQPVTDYATAKQSDTEQFARFYREMLRRGIYLPPSQFEVIFVSAVHSILDIAETKHAIMDAFAAMKQPEED